MKPLRGVIPALLTASNEDGSINEAGIREIIENAIQNGVCGIFPLGSSGEFTAYTLEEKEYILSVAISQTAGRVPVIAGCGAPSTREALRLCRMAEKQGADCVAIVTPYYISPTQEDIYLHYRQLAESSALPILLYNIPARTGLRISPALLGRLKELPNVVGIKDSGGDMDVFREYMAYNSDDFQVIMGIDTKFLTAFRMGATAAVSGPANSIPKNQVNIYRHFTEGRIEEAERCQERFCRLMPILTSAPGPTMVKEAANIVGLHAGPPLSPLRRPTGEIWKRLSDMLHEEFADCFVGQQSR